MDTGSMIAKLRKKAGYTQNTLAEALHITGKAVSKWERGLCLPDSSLLPKLSALLNVDIENLISAQNQSDVSWVGYLDLRDLKVKLDHLIYDKPVAYYILSAFMLCDVRNIYVHTDCENRAYLSKPLFRKLGFHFNFEFDEIPGHNVMALDGAVLLFGSDLTRQLRGAMAARQQIKMVPATQKPTFLFVPAERGSFQPDRLKQYYAEASERTQGRGMLRFDLNTSEGLAAAEAFVALYQGSTGLLLSSLEEIALQKHIILKEKNAELSKNTKYFKYFIE